MNTYKFALALILGLIAAPVYGAEDIGVLQTLQNAATANGNGTDLRVRGYTTAAVQVTISGTATVTFKATADGSTYENVVCSPSTGGTATATATSTGLYQCTTAGMDFLRAPVSGCSGCTVTVKGQPTTSAIGGGGGSSGSVDTEMPSAAALADDTANPTVPGVAAFLMCYDGSTWDRCQGGLTDTDDNSIAFSQVPTLTITIPYVSNGTTHERQRKFVYLEDDAETAGAGLAMAGSVRRDTAATSAGTTGDNATINTDALGLLWTRNLDPCSGTAKSYLPVSISTATTTEITPSLAGASTHYYICSINLITAAANNVLVADDDTDNCASPTTGIFGSDGTPAASEGWNFAANGGIVLGSGASSIGRTQGTNRVICILTSAATQLSGMIVVVAAP